MRLVILAVFALVVTERLSAQAPAAAGLWRVATGSLARPAALEDGPTGAFWNPAADPHGRLTAGTQVIQTSDILGLSGFVAGATYRVGAFGHLGVVLGRMDVRDLIRTTTSPSSEPGGIAVFEQFAGLAIRMNRGPAALGTVVRIHDAQFDLDAEHGATVDFGLLLTPFPGLTLAAASHLLPANLSSDFATDYFVGAEYERSMGSGPLPTRAVARYGAALHQSGDLDHELGWGLRFRDHFFVDAGVAGESAYGRRSWRPALSVSMRVGRYTLGVARGEGLNGIGATYRVLLDVEIVR